MNNQPHQVVDLATSTVVALFDSHDDALQACFGLEPVPTREDGWRYVVQPAQGDA